MNVFTQAYAVLVLFWAVVLFAGVFICCALGRILYSTGFPDEVVKWFDRLK